jgi:hypothetical protein
MIKIGSTGSRFKTYFIHLTCKFGDTGLAEVTVHTLDAAKLVS